MSDSTQPKAGNLFLAVSVSSGAVSSSERTANDSWSKFAPVYTPAVHGERAAQISALFEKTGSATTAVPLVGFTTTTVPPRLFFTSPGAGGARQRPNLLVAGIAPADVSFAQRGVDTFEVHAVGVGAPSLAGWASGLPTYELKEVLARRLLEPTGDLLAAADTSRMDPADVIVGLGTAWPQVCVITEAGRLFFDHDASVVNPFEDVPAQAGNPGHIVGASCSGPHVVAVTDDGVIHHTIRGNDGRYTAFENVNALAKTKLKFRQAATASFNNGANLHLVATTPDGGLYYAQWGRHIDRPGWSQFEDVKAKAGNDPGHVTSVAVAV
jgi:hypothetical protein